jgi:hypothetical protein
LELNQLEGQKKTSELYDDMGGFQASKASGAAVAAFSKTPLGLLTSGPFGMILKPLGPILQNTISEATEEWGVMGDVLTGLAVTVTDGPLAALVGAVTENALAPIESLGKENLGEMAKQMLEKGLTLEDSSKEEIGELYREIFNTEMPNAFYESMMENKDAFYELGASLHAVDV